MLIDASLEPSLELSKCGIAAAAMAPPARHRKERKTLVLSGPKFGLAAKKSPESNRCRRKFSGRSNMTSRLFFWTIARMPASIRSYSFQMHSIAKCVRFAGNRPSRGEMRRKFLCVISILIASAIFNKMTAWDPK